MHKALEQSEIFEGLDSSDVGRIASIAKRKSLRTGEYLFLLGDHAEGLYVVLSGTVEVCFPMSFGGSVKDIAVETHTPGKALGWSAFVKPYRFTLSARAAEPAEVVALRRRDLLEIFDENPKLGRVFIERLAELIGRRLLTIQALWARELQRAMAGGLPETSTGAKQA